MSQLTVDIVTPEKLVFSGNASEVRVPGAAGEFGVLPGHTIFLALMRPGLATIDLPAGGQKTFVVSHGFAEAGPERVVLLTDACDDPADIDKTAADAARRDAEQVLGTAKPGSREFQDAQAALEWAQARLEA